MRQYFVYLFNRLEAGYERFQEWVNSLTESLKNHLGSDMLGICNISKSNKNKKWKNANKQKCERHRISDNPYKPDIPKFNLRVFFNSLKWDYYSCYNRFPSNLIKNSLSRV